MVGDHRDCDSIAPFDDRGFARRIRQLNLPPPAHKPQPTVQKWLPAAEPEEQQQGEAEDDGRLAAATSAGASAERCAKLALRPLNTTRRAASRM